MKYVKDVVIYNLYTISIQIKIYNVIKYNK